MLKPMSEYWKKPMGSKKTKLCNEKKRWIKYIVALEIKTEFIFSAGNHGSHD